MTEISLNTRNTLNYMCDVEPLERPHHRPAGTLSVLVSICFNFFGNWLGFQADSPVVTHAFDLVKTGIMELVAGGHMKQTYHPSKRDQAVIFDARVVETYTGPDSDAHLVQVFLDSETPDVQADDVLVDINVTRWGFHRSLTHAERMLSDPKYRQEVATEDLRITRAMKSKLTLTSDSSHLANAEQLFCAIILLCEVLHSI